MAFFNTLSFLIDHILFFTDHEQYFLGKYLHILHIEIYNLQYDVAFSAYYHMFYWSWVDSFEIYMHILHICSTRKTRDGRKCVKNFGVLGVSGLNQ